MAQVRSLLFVSALAFLGFSVATTQPSRSDQEKNAEDVYKNIKSFKGKKASDIIPAMHAMSQALSVDCSFCHADGDFASDDKGPKATAREMIELTNGLNEKYFEGRLEVTCFTCHAGREHPDAVASPFPITSRLRPGTTSSADPVLEAYAAAVKSPTVKTHIELKGTIEQHGQTLELTTDESSTGMFYEAADMKMGYDGKDAWYNAGGGAVAVPMPDGEALIRYGRPYWGGLPKLDGAKAATEKIGDKSMKAVLGTITGTKQQVKYYFDQATGLLARVVFFDHSIVGRMNDVYDYEDYKSVGGTMVPMKVTHHESMKIKAVRTYTSARVVADLDEKVYSPH